MSEPDRLSLRQSMSRLGCGAAKSDAPNSQSRYRAPWDAHGRALLAAFLFPAGNVSMDLTRIPALSGLVDESTRQRDEIRMLLHLAKAEAEEARLS